MSMKSSISTDKANPLAMLASLERLAVETARPLPVDIVETVTWQGVGFSIAGVTCVCPLEDVLEILTFSGVTEVPGVEDYTLGLINIRGSLIPLIDMGRFIGGECTPVKSVDKFLIIKKDSFLSGLVVDDIYGVKLVDIDTISDKIAKSPDSIKKYIIGKCFVNDDQAFIFSVSNLIKEEAFKDVSYKRARS